LSLLGDRETVWLEAEYFRMPASRQLLETIADFVKPFPMAVLQKYDHTILYVNDKYYTTTSHPVAPHPGAVPGSGELNAYERDVEATDAEPIVRGSNHSTAKSGNQSIGRAVAAISSSQIASPSSSGPRENNQSIPQLDPTKPQQSPDAGDDSEMIPFVAVLTLVDSAGIEQGVQMEFGLDVSTPPVEGPNQVITNTTMSSVEISFHDPSIKGKPILTRPQIPHVRAQKIAVYMKPSSATNDFVLLSNRQKPKSDFLDKSTTTIRNRGFTFGTSVSANPSAQGGVTINKGESTEQIPLARAFGVGMIRIGRSHAGESYWKYPMAKAAPYSSSISLPIHTSSAKYSPSKPLQLLKVALEACLEIKPEAKPKKLSKDRATPLILDLGYKHVTMSFVVEVKKQQLGFICLQGHGRIGSTVRLRHDLLSPQSIWQEVSTENQEALATLNVII
jgi:hypothetical protein